MSVDKFGRYSGSRGKSVNTRGPPGVGYKLTLNGNFNIENRRLENVGEPAEKSDATTVNFVETEIKNEMEKFKKDLSLQIKNNENALKTLTEQISQYKNQSLDDRKSIRANQTTIFDIRSQIAAMVTNQAKLFSDDLKIRETIEDFKQYITKINDVIHVLTGNQNQILIDIKEIKNQREIQQQRRQERKQQRQQEPVIISSENI